jgi:Peptidoglycan-binding protein, CsiV
MIVIRNLILLCASLLVSASLLAADKYDVELIVFERSSKTAAMNESWPEDPGKPDLHDVTHVTSSKGLYAKLPNSKRTLNAVASRMRRASGKPVRLTHMLWRQPALSSKDATPVYISGSTKTGTLTGTAKVSVRRYLHLDLDLLLESPSGAAPGRYRMQAHRRMRSGKLHYIDHPAMGVLVMIRRVK